MEKRYEPDLRRPIWQIQDRIAAAFELTSEDRAARVTLLLERSRGGSAAYWLQLGLAMAIAILGLTLDSTAVVIGAMLISPLMGPIVELGTGLAVGSPLLVIRSFARVSKSVVFVVGGAALITVALPFHEVTGEIAARTSPTVLDLLVAVCCAIAAAYAQLRPGSETSGTAAGTAVGIALVPPICVVGYGIGTRSGHVAAGAALLFTANLCAILLFAVVCFLLVGFNRVSVAELEAEDLSAARGGLATSFGRSLAKVFTSRLGSPLRVLMPLALVATIFFPLRRALEEVSWEIRVRTKVENILSHVSKPTVHTTLSVKRHTVTLRVITVGSSAEATKLRVNLQSEIAAFAGVTPQVDVFAVASAGALRAVSEMPTAQSHVEPAVDLERARRVVGETLAADWPADAAGPLAHWTVSMSDDGLIRVDVVHEGVALGASGTTLLARALDSALETTTQRTRVNDIAVSTAPVAVTGDPRAWLSDVLPRANQALAHDGVFACMTVMSSDTLQDAGADASAPDAGDASTNVVITDTLKSSPAFATGRLSMVVGDRWSIRFSASPCADAPADGGASNASRSDVSSSLARLDASPRQDTDPDAE